MWSHKSYKANIPLRILLMILHSIDAHHPLHQWIRNHRVHHKHTETVADPHNIERGIFFAHMGYLMCHPSSESKKAEEKLDFSDVDSDAVVQFQNKHFLMLKLLCGFAIPTLIPMYCWGETLRNSFYMASMARFVIVLNTEGLVNSLSHVYGNRTYDR
jgi:stearoyl-CoA desaturase (Delta-9 desaturase)